MLVGAMLQYPHTCSFSKQYMALLCHFTLCIISCRKSYISYTIPNWNSAYIFAFFMSEYVKQQWLHISSSAVKCWLWPFICPHANIQWMYVWQIPSFIYVTFYMKIQFGTTKIFECAFIFCDGFVARVKTMSDDQTAF